MKKPTVTIGIIAYNESKNIQTMLSSVVQQAETNFRLREILLISDGSTDTTVKKARRIKHKKLIIRAYTVRIGKSERLNQLFQKAKGNIIVLLDADVILATKYTVAELIKPLIKSPRVGLVGGCPMPQPATTFIEQAVNASFAPYNLFRTKLRHGKNPYGCDGRILALSHEFADRITVPTNMIANDAFMYFSCLTHGFRFAHVPTAKVWFRSPQTLRDHLKQNTRFVAAHYRLERTFGSLVTSEYGIPKRLLYVNLCAAFIQDPIHALGIFLINLYCKQKAQKAERGLNAKWNIARTTKAKLAYKTI